MTERRAQMEAVILKNQTGLLRYAATVLNNRDMARQVVQDVFIKLFSHWDELDKSEGCLRVWLFRVTHNEAVDLIRAEERRKSRQARYAEAQNLIQEEEATLDFERGERMELVLRHVRELSLPRQRVLLLRLQQGLSYGEISEVTGYTVPTCRNLLSQAVAQLTELLNPKGGAYA
ncbi:MAG: sigma-70 family RNA polymerase sigma factor [Kiritimatiellae bacterium]|nr:sigma-70 family RNA polymerase sigma factor [Kiritimatiellia bacterium]